MGRSSKKVSPAIRRRTCVGCGREDDKGSFMRVVRSPNGEIVVEGADLAQGRGAYLCAQIECVRAARKKNSLARALKHQVKSEVYDMLEERCCGERHADP